MESANKNKVQVVALDTNFLTAIYQLKLDVFQQIKDVFGNRVKFIVPDNVLTELEKISKKGRKLTSAKIIATKLMKINKVKKVKTTSNDVDTALLELAKKGAIVATNDRLLKRKIKKNGGSVLHIRQKKYIELW